MYLVTNLSNNNKILCATIKGVSEYTGIYYGTLHKGLKADRYYNEPYLIEKVDVA